MVASLPNISFTARCMPGKPYLSLCVHLCLEILFILIKNHPNIKGIEILEYCYLYTAYADDTTFFLKDENSTVHLSEKFKLFSDFLGFKPNTDKCKITGIGVLKGVQVAVCGMKCIDLRNEAMKILDIILLIQSENKRRTKFL